jgi:hypothetical protein
MDLVYDFGDLKLPKDSSEAAAHVESIIEKQEGLDLDRYDTFIKVGDRYFHVSSGAGRAVVENTEYEKEQAGKQVVPLAKKTK